MNRHIGVLCPDASGHFLPMTSLTAELIRRGHRVTYFMTPDGAADCRSQGLKASVIGEQAFPLGSRREIFDTLGRLTGFAAARYTAGVFERAMRVLQEEAPTALRESGVDALLADESIFVARNISDQLQLPWFTVCNAFPFHPDPSHPPLLPALAYRTGFWAGVRNAVARLPGRLVMGGIRRIVIQHRRRLGLPPYSFREGNASRLATFAQLPAELDYPRSLAAPWFHYVGGLHDPRARPRIDFPWDRLDGRPVLYASLGTAQNRLLHVFRMIAEAAAETPMQLVLSLGGGARPEQLGDLPGDPIVVSFAPQLQLVEIADLVITHGGMNTTIETLAQGKPMIVLPVTNDQPAVARRVAWSGCGVAIPIGRVSRDRLLRAIREVSGNAAYQTNAKRLAEANRRAGGAMRAADVMESAFTGASGLARQSVE